MPVHINYEEAKRTLKQLFDEAETSILTGQRFPEPPACHEAIDALFTTKTQSYREALLGALLARFLNSATDLRLPYVEQGERAFSGRSLDEKVVNPMLRELAIPCTKGPYLAVFRRSVKFDKSIAAGLKDRSSYEAFLQVIDAMQAAPHSELRACLLYMCYKFLLEREGSNLRIQRVKRLTLPQSVRLVSELVERQSGGRFPVILVVAGLQTLRDRLGLNWEIEWQPINAPDSASGALGDITVLHERKVLMAAEVTLRRVTRKRVAEVFEQKISPMSISDYLFFMREGEVEDEAVQLADQYFHQGYAVEFVDIVRWLSMTLATLGQEGRTSFVDCAATLLEGSAVPVALKKAWNDAINNLVSDVRTR